MLRTRFIFGLSVLFLAGGIVVFAQGRSTGPKSTYTTTAPKAAPSPPTTTKTSPVKPMKTTQPTMKSGSATQPKSSPTKTQKTDKTTAKADKPANTKSTTTKAATGTTSPTIVELTPVQQKLKENTSLAAKVATRLPQGTDVISAAAGFKNLGQFIAAANVSNNLQISFTELKARMMSGMSLGQAIQAVRPLTASPTVEAQRAEYDARGMIVDSEQATSSTTATAPSTTSTSTPVKTKAKTKNSAQ